MDSLHRMNKASSNPSVITAVITVISCSIWSNRYLLSVSSVGVLLPFESEPCEYVYVCMRVSICVKTA